jgi:cellulose synthase/poly-beta-1,6-N-acetylglucosamine synthase-like glycosyltransferase
LKDLNFPSENYELIFVDDQSSDNTTEIIKNHLSGINYRILSAKEKELPAKKGALEIGIKNARFNIIAITDADCQPERDWLKSISIKISQGYEIVFGYSPLKAGKNLISKISSFENLRNYILYFASAGLNIPYSATSRSFAFTKEAFYKLNGYRNTSETLSGDDDLLIREAVKMKLKIGTFRFENDIVYSNPSESLREYLNRKSRHLKTSHHYLIRHQILLGFWHSINIFSLYSVLLLPVSFLFITPFTVKIFSDSFIIRYVRKYLPHNFRFYQVIFLQMIYENFLIINFINSVFRKDKWK